MGNIGSAITKTVFNMSTLFKNKKTHYGLNVIIIIYFSKLNLIIWLLHSFLHLWLMFLQ